MDRQELQQLISALDRVLVLFDTPGWHELKQTLEARIADVTHEVMSSQPGRLSPEEVAHRQGRVRELRWLLDRQSEAFKERSLFTDQLTQLNELAQVTE